MHLARLLMAGTAVLSEGEMRVDVGDARDRLLAVRRGDVSWDEYERWRLELQAGFDRAVDKSPLPEKPDVPTALEFVRRLRAADIPRRRRAIPLGDDRPPVLDPVIDARLPGVATGLGKRVVFATVSGAHLYGFASADSDWDLRAAHALPLERFAGLHPDGPDEVRAMRNEDGLELDLVSTEVGKFAAMLLKRNGYVLEQVLSPLVVVGGAEHDELAAIARACPTVRHAHHYLGFLAGQRREAQRRTTVKTLLYCLRVSLTGIWLMRSGTVEANLPRLLDAMPLPAGLPAAAVRDLIARKTLGGEHGRLAADELGTWDLRLDRLAADLEAARDASALPLEPSMDLRRQLDDFVRRARGHSTLGA